MGSTRRRQRDSGRDGASLFAAVPVRNLLVLSLLLVAGLAGVMLLSSSQVPTDFEWYDSTWRHRVGLEITAQVEMQHWPVERQYNFTALLRGENDTGTFDNDSIRVFEYDANGNLLREVPYQFDEAAEYNASTNAVGELVFQLNGTTSAGTTRYFFVYFDSLAHGAKPAVSYPTNLVYNVGSRTATVNTTKFRYFLDSNRGNGTSGIYRFQNSGGQDVVEETDETARAAEYLEYTNGTHDFTFNLSGNMTVYDGPLRLRLVQEGYQNFYGVDNESQLFRVKKTYYFYNYSGTEGSDTVAFLKIKHEVTNVDNTSHTLASTPAGALAWDLNRTLIDTAGNRILEDNNTDPFSWARVLDGGNAFAGLINLDESGGDYVADTHDLPDERIRSGINLSSTVLGPGSSLSQTSFLSTGISFGDGQEQFLDQVAPTRSNLVSMFKNQPTVTEFGVETYNATVVAGSNATVYNRNETIQLTGDVIDDPYNLTRYVNATLNHNSTGTADDSTIVLQRNTSEQWDETTFWYNAFSLNETANVGVWTVNVSTFTADKLLLTWGTHTFNVSDQYLTNLSLQNPVEVAGTLIYGNLSVQNVRGDQNITGANVSCSYGSGSIPASNITEFGNGVYTFNFTAPFPAGDYTLTCDAARSGNTGSDSEPFRSEVATVDPNVTFTPPNYASSIITLLQGDAFVFATNVSNAQNGTASDTNLSYALPTDWAANTTFQQCGDLPPQDSCGKEVNVTIPNATQPGDYNVTVTLDWTNPNDSPGQSEQNFTVTVESNPVLNVTEEQLSDSFGGGRTKHIGNVTVDSIGNDNLTDVTFTCVPGSGDVCDNFSTTFTPVNLSTVDEGTNRSVALRVGVDTAYTPGTYTGTVNVTGVSTFDTFTVQITVIGTTTVDTDTIPTGSVTANGVTQTDNTTVAFDVNSTNTGQAFAFSTNQSLSLPSGWSSNDTFEQCSDLNTSESCTRNYFVTVPNATAPGTYTVTATSTWKNPDGSTDTSTHDLDVDVASNPVQNVTDRFLNASIPSGTNASLGNITIDSLGNDQLSSINYACMSGSGAVCDNFTTTFDPTSIASIPAGSNASVNVNVAVPTRYRAGDYTGTLNVSSDGGFHLVTVNVTVPVTRAWTLNPTTCEQASDPVAGTACTPVINNTGNAPLNLTIVPSSANNTNVTPVNLTLPFDGTTSFNVTYNVSSNPGQIYRALYNVTAEQDALPDWRTLNVTIIPSVPPVITTNITPQVFQQLGVTKIRSNVTAASGFPLDRVIADITLPTGATVSETLPQVNGTSISGIFETFYPNETAGNTSAKGVYTVNITANDSIGNSESVLYNFTVTANLSVFLQTGLDAYIQGESGSIIYNLSDIDGNGVPGADVNFTITDAYGVPIWLDQDNPFTTLNNGRVEPHPTFDLKHDYPTGVYTVTANMSWYDSTTNLTEKRSNTDNFVVEKKGDLDADLDAGSVWFPGSNLTLWTAISKAGTLQDPDSIDLSILWPNLSVRNTANLSDFSRERKGIYFYREQLSDAIDKGIYYTKLTVGEGSDETVAISSFRVASQEFAIGEFDIIPAISTPEVPQGDYVEFNITIRNPELPPGDVKLEYWVSGNGTRYAYTSEAIYIEENQTMTVPRNLFIFSDQPTGTYTLNTRISRGNNEAVGNSTFKVIQGEPEPEQPDPIIEEETQTEERPIPRPEPEPDEPTAPRTNVSIVDAPSVLNVARGESEVFSVMAANTGETVLHNLSLSIVGIPPAWRTIQPTQTAELVAEDVTVFTVTLDVPDDAQLQQYNATFLVTAVEDSDRRSASIKVFESLRDKIAADIDRLETRLEGIRTTADYLAENGVDVADVRELITQIEVELQSAESAVADDDLRTALEHVSVAETAVDDAESILDKLEAPEERLAFDLLPLVVGVLILLALVLGAVYMVKVRDVEPLGVVRNRIHDVMMDMKRRQMEQDRQLKEDKEKTKRLLKLLEAQRREEIIDEETYNELKSSAEEKLRQINKKLAD